MPIQILSYRSTWPEEFQAIGKTLRNALAERAIRIDHIGSTAVPGLAAKDVIDIQITAAHLDPEIAQRLKNLDYLHIERITGDHIPVGDSSPPQHWNKWFFKSAPDSRATNIHVRIAGHPNQQYPLLFRDYLRANRNAAENYAKIKLQLARHHPEDFDAYYDIKDPLCDIIMENAMAWANLIQWAPPPSDC